MIRDPAVRVLLLVPLLLGSLACGTARQGLTESELRQIVAQRGLPTEDVELPFKADDEMRAWVKEHVSTLHVPEVRIDKLLEVLLLPDGLGLTYDARFTGTAPEAFRQRRANCLGFTNLFVALGRELQVPVYFLAVDQVEDFQRAGVEDLVVISRHVTAGYGPGHDVKVLEFDLGPDLDYFSARPLSDHTAVALYYSNRGAEKLQEGDPGEARKLLAVAVAVDPKLPLAWVNLGVARRRLGDLDGAEAAYHKALEIDSRTVSAYQNLASVARARGDEKEATRLLALIPQLKSRNPFHFLTLGDLDLVQGRLDDARRHYRKALRLYPDSPEPRAALGLLALMRGDRAGAERWLRRASRVDAANPRVVRLRLRLEAEGGATEMAQGRPPG